MASSKKPNYRKGKPNNRKGKYSSPRDEKQTMGKTGPQSEQVPATAGKSSLNDVSWYTRYPHLTAATANIPFPNRPGMAVELTDVTGNKPDMNARTTIPGALGIQFVPSVGFSDSNTSPISLAAREIYAKVRNAFSGQITVDAPDFVMYLMALDSIFMEIGYMKRILRLCNSWTPNNFDLPYSALKVMMPDITFEQIQKFVEDRHLGWNYINELALMTRKFTCPAVMDTFNRHYWMCDNVYADAPDLMGQMYVFTPAGFYLFDETTDPKGGKLEFTSTTALVSWDELYRDCLNRIQRLSASADTYTINGYLMRAYEGQPAFYVEEIAINEALAPVYEPEVLMQIENTRTVSVSTGTLDITQDPNTNALLHKPKANVPASSFFPLPMINLRTPDSSQYDVVVASRLQPSLITAGEESPNSYYIIAGTEIPSRFIYANYDTARQEFVDYWDYISVSSITTASAALLSEVLRKMSGASQFDWHPFLYIFYNGFEFIHGDVFNITTLSVDQLAKIHRVCVLSEFNAFSTN